MSQAGGPTLAHVKAQHKTGQETSVIKLHSLALVPHDLITAALGPLPPLPLLHASNPAWLPLPLLLLLQGWSWGTGCAVFDLGAG